MTIGGGSSSKRVEGVDRDVTWEDKVAADVRAELVTDRGKKMETGRR